MEQFIALTKKYGVTGVLAMWLWHTDSRLNKVESALYDCYKTQSIVKKTLVHRLITQINGTLYCQVKQKLELDMDTLSFDTTEQNQDTVLLNYTLKKLDNVKHELESESHFRTAVNVLELVAIFLVALFMYSKQAKK